MGSPQFPETRQNVRKQITRLYVEHKKRFSMGKIEQALRATYPEEFLVEIAEGQAPYLEPKLDIIGDELDAFYGLDLVWLEDPEKGASA